MGPSGSRFDPKKKMLMTPGAIQNLCKQQGKNEGTVSSSPTYCVCVSRHLFIVTFEVLLKYLIARHLSMNPP